MRRRRFLATTAVAGGLLAGCTGSDGGTNESTAGAGDGTAASERRSRIRMSLRMINAGSIFEILFFRLM